MNKVEFLPQVGESAELCRDGDANPVGWSHKFAGNRRSGSRKFAGSRQLL